MNTYKSPLNLIAEDAKILYEEINSNIIKSYGRKDKKRKKIVYQTRNKEKITDKYMETL
jgi:hypothetical protein